MMIIYHFQLKCCGAQEYRDWSNTTFGGTGNVPDSCCHADVPGCGEGILKKTQNEVSVSPGLEQQYTLGGYNNEERISSFKLQKED
jgi:hypothetical protein